MSSFSETRLGRGLLGLTGTLIGALAVLALLYAVGYCSLAQAQTPQSCTTPEPTRPTADVSVTYGPTPPSAPRALSIDELLTLIGQLKAQRADLEKREKEAVALLKAKLKEQMEKIHKLGIIAGECVAPVANTTSGPPTTCPVDAAIPRG